MRPPRRDDIRNAPTEDEREAVKLLTPTEERSLLLALGECKAKLAEALGSVRRAEDVPDDPHALAHFVSAFYADAGNGPTARTLGAVFHRYKEIRSRLAMANLRLVAHVAKRFRDRGIDSSDLLQEGFRGLLEAIDRFDATRETKLATYATWWIRQAIQQAVASGAYPVRLSPRHLRRLAQNQSEVERGAVASESTEIVRRIHAATRPTVSLNVSFSDSKFNLAQTLSAPDEDTFDDSEREATLGRLLGVLGSREQEVLALRFGLGGKNRLSLSQVGKVLDVSKERVRQIQERALAKLRAVAIEAGGVDAFVTD